ncbi:hypothetical protein OPT61_g426 [Boeremia exigua]|uniref:Uncharacterized protein n=1 Tax=Boeremia exigua TaxID=749465 RepID=A0ACC2ITY8_9PLEO|nr:hypothetical protein OPT61_g426 [Boeremia exigua]
MENLQPEDIQLAASLRETILAHAQTKFTQKNGYRSWKGFDVVVNQVGDTYVARVIARGEAEGQPGYHDGWTSVVKSNNGSSPLAALDSLFVKLREATPGDAFEGHEEQNVSVSEKTSNTLG